MPWIQEYAPVGGVVVSACVAAIPLLILFYMLAVRKAKGHIAAVAGLASALIVAVAIWGMPVSLGDQLHSQWSCLRSLPHRVDRHHGSMGL